ncbi:MAG: histidine triad nucleotide-binding protein [Gemmatimonadales bacterium]|nr:histidine triad nucleotide-binding protein [Gemmatimonadales bacterium]
MSSIFTKIIRGEIPAKVVKRQDDMIAFHDVNPQAPVHVLVVPVQEVAAVRDCAGPEGQALLGRLMQFAAQVATELGLDADGYRLVTNTGRYGGQSVFHLHVHIMGGRPMGWPPG